MPSFFVIRPTPFAHVIEAIIDLVESNNQYHVLVIIVDGWVITTSFPHYFQGCSLNQHARAKISEFISFLQNQSDHI